MNRIMRTLVMFNPVYKTPTEKTFDNLERIVKHSNDPRERHNAAMRIIALRRWVVDMDYEMDGKLDWRDISQEDINEFFRTSKLANEQHPARLALMCDRELGLPEGEYYYAKTYVKEGVIPQYLDEELRNVIAFPTISQQNTATAVRSA